MISSATTKPKIAVPSARAAPSSRLVWILPEASGWREIASVALPVAMPMPMPPPIPVSAAMPAPRAISPFIILISFFKLIFIFELKKPLSNIDFSLSHWEPKEDTLYQYKIVSNVLQPKLTIKFGGFLMGKNKMENFIFTSIVCFFMILGMSSYNSILKNGFNSSIISGVFVPFIPIFFIALAIDWFLVGPLAKKIAGFLTNENTVFIKKILLISFFMVTGMSLCMSFLATILGYGLKSGFLVMFIKTELKNFIMAFPLQIILAGPLSRLIFFKIFPVEAIKA